MMPHLLLLTYLRVYQGLHKIGSRGVLHYYLLLVVFKADECKAYLKFFYCNMKLLTISNSNLSE